MSSHLRLQSSLEQPISTGIYQASPTLSRSAIKQKMSLTQTYYVASTARTKLGREARNSDHNLRRLVGHANLLDSLMIELADAEREQEAWFNKSVHKASSAPEQPSHISWAMDEDMEDDDSDMSDDDSDIYDEDDDVLFNLPLRKIRSPPIDFFSQEIDEDADYTDDDEDLEDEEEMESLSLQRVASQHSPPELTLDSEESDSDDDSMPPSPELASFDISEKERQSITTTSFYNMDAVLQQQRQQPMIAAC